MNSNKITRKVSPIGSVTIPKEICDQINLKMYDDVECCIDDGKIILRKSEIENAAYEDF